MNKNLNNYFDEILTDRDLNINAKFKSLEDIWDGLKYNLDLNFNLKFDAEDGLLKIENILVDVKAPLSQMFDEDFHLKLINDRIEKAKNSASDEQRKIISFTQNLIELNKYNLFSQYYEITEKLFTQLTGKSTADYSKYDFINSFDLNGEEIIISYLISLLDEINIEIINHFNLQEDLEYEKILEALDEIKNKSIKSLLPYLLRNISNNIKNENFEIQFV